MAVLDIRAPGVYIQEIPSGARTIVGVATSITAFVGGAARGPLNQPTACSGFGDYQRLFGGLHPDSLMSQSVRHFFTNRGGQALIVRVVNQGEGLALTAADGITGTPGVVRFEVEVSDVVGDTFQLDIRGLDVAGEPVADASGSVAVDLAANPETTIEALQSAGGDDLVSVVVAASAQAPTVGVLASSPDETGLHSLTVGPAPAVARVRLGPDLLLVAADPGSWGSRLTATVFDQDAPGSTFHLTLEQLDDAGNVVQQETHYALSADANDARFLPRVLERRSAMARAGADTFAVPAVVVGEAFLGGGDGTAPTPSEMLGQDSGARSGMYALRHADIFNLLCLPRQGWDSSVAADLTFWSTAMRFVESERAFLLVDPPDDWASAAAAEAGAQAFAQRSDNAAMYFPRVLAANPLQEGRLAEFPPCGVVAGIIARTDGQRGIWKAPAGIDASASGVVELVTPLTNEQQGGLNRSGINAFRTFPTSGTVLWGARTLSGADILASDWKYISVRRLALFLQESLYRGTQWAVFEPNGEALWGQLRMSVGSFMHGIFRQGAFAGSSKAEAYSVACDRQTTTVDDTNRGVVNVVIGFAPLRPAEFVILRIQQLVSQGG